MKTKNSRGFTKTQKVDKNMSNTIITTTTTVDDHVFIETEFLANSRLNSFQVNMIIRSISKLILTKELFISNV